MNRAQKFLQQRLPWILSALLIAACAWLLAKLVWAVLTPADTSLPVAQNTTISATNTNSVSVNRVNITKLVNLHLFGETAAVSKAPPKPRVAPTAPVRETSLRNLKLEGLIASSDPTLARAVIKDGNKPSKVFAVDQEIISGAILNKILADHVLIERNGVLEILRMKKVTATASAQPSDNNSRNRRAIGAPAATLNNNAPVGERIQNARQELLNDPSKVSQYLRYRPQMKDGQVVGYRVYPGKDRALFRDVGLRSGDLVTQINGIPLSDPAQALALIPQLQTATSATLTIQRRGQEQTVNVSTTN